jgi:ABC-type nitrate/sulfonate/bicarbonate transport system substrate-binding protein
MKFRGASLASAVALIFLVPGCGGLGNGAGLPAPEKPNIVVDAFPAIDSAGLYIAQMDHLFTAQGLNVTIPPRDVRFDSNVAFPAVAASLQGGKIGAAFAPEPFVSLDEQNYGIQELADLDQGSTVDFPIQGYAVTQAWADKYPHTLAAFLRALSRGQEIADTDRTAVELALGQYLQIPRQTAAFLSLPSFPTGVDPARLQRVVSAMLRFGLLPSSDDAFRITSMTGA